MYVRVCTGRVIATTKRERALIVIIYVVVCVCVCEWR